MFKSATFKLTVWYLCLAEFITLIFSLVVYNIGSQQISNGLHMQSERIYNHFPVFENNNILHPDKDINTSEHILFIRIIFLNVVVLILSGIVSYWLAKQTLKPIEEAHEQQKRFTADVSHELRTPLTAIKMESEVALLNAKTDKKDLRNTLSSNLEEVGRLENIINNLLKLSTLEASALKEEFSEVSTKEAAKRAANEVSKKAKQRDITISLEIIDQKVLGDSDNIVQMLVIILDNAIKYSPSGSKINFIVKTDGKDKVIFEVSDNGTGIKKDALDHIFDRFYQATTSRNKKDNEGYGLGLSIAKNIADIHRAVINVRSQEGKGTTVDVIFSKSI